MCQHGLGEDFIAPVELERAVLDEQFQQIELILRIQLAGVLAEQIIGTAGVFLGAMNAAGGYVVTERMLEMFKPSDKKSDKTKAPRA